MIDNTVLNVNKNHVKIAWRFDWQNQTFLAEVKDTYFNRACGFQQLPCLIAM